MKKGLFLILTILTLGISHVSADIAAPVINDKIIKVEIRDSANINDVLDKIQKVDGVFYASITDPRNESEECKPCEKCEVTKCSTSETLSDNDIKGLKTATLIIYITLGILVVLMIIIIALMINRRKKDSKKDA